MMKTTAPFLALLLVAAAVRLPAAAPLAPEAYVSLRGVVRETVAVGEPLFVAVRLETPFESPGPVELAPAAGTWADGVELVLTRGDSPLPLRATAAFQPTDSRVKLDADHAAGGEWYFSSAQTAQLAPGDYRVQGRLTLRDGSGWTGTVSSEPVTIHVVAPSNAPDRLLQLTLARANEAVVSDRLEEAAHLVDTLLADQPDNLRLLSLRARVCARAGDLRGAMTCVTRAMSTREVEELQHPPIGLFELQDEIGQAMLSPEWRNTRPPEWTKLPPRVLELMRPPAPVAKSGALTVTLPIPVVAAPATNAAAPVPPAVAPPVQVSPKTPAEPSAGVVVPTAELPEAKILADSNGQWAASAVAGTQYGRTQYSAAKATGAPSVPVVGNSPDAWCPASKTSGTDWLEVTFAKPVHATEVRVRQNDAAGAIAKIEAIEPGGTPHVWWEGADPYVASARDIVWFAVRVPPTDYVVARVRITLNLAAGPGWKEIDAVQLVGKMD